MQIANLIHMATAYVAIGLALVHIYLGTIGMSGAYHAMRYGDVSESWAEHHHLRWYERVRAGKAPEKFIQPGAARDERRAAETFAAAGLKE